VSGSKDIPDPKGDKIATAQLAIYGQVEQSEVARVARHLDSHPDGPNMLWAERELLPDDAPLIPGSGQDEERAKDQWTWNYLLPTEPTLLRFSDVANISSKGPHVPRRAENGRSLR
jgi:hypothetical protein